MNTFNPSRDEILDEFDSVWEVPSWDHGVSKEEYSALKERKKFIDRNIFWRGFQTALRMQRENENGIKEFPKTFEDEYQFHGLNAEEVNAILKLKAEGEFTKESEEIEREIVSGIEISENLLEKTGISIGKYRKALFLMFGDYIKKLSPLILKKSDDGSKTIYDKNDMNTELLTDAGRDKFLKYVEDHPASVHYYTKHAP